MGDKRRKGEEMIDNVFRDNVGVDMREKENGRWGEGKREGGEEREEGGVRWSFGKNKKGWFGFWCLLVGCTMKLVNW